MTEWGAIRDLEDDFGIRLIDDDYERTFNLKHKRVSQLDKLHARRILAHDGWITAETRRLAVRSVTPSPINKRTSETIFTLSHPRGRVPLSVGRTVTAATEAPECHDRACLFRPPSTTQAPPDGSRPWSWLPSLLACLAAAPGGIREELDYKFVYLGCCGGGYIEEFDPLVNRSARPSASIA